MIPRAVFILIILVGVGVALTTLLNRAAVSNSFSCKNCNVIVISIENLGAKYTSLFDPTLDTTPFLASLADQSIVFDHAYVQAPWDFASHVSMFTGRYPWDLGIWTDKDAIASSTLTIAKVLRASGYDTAAFSNTALPSQAYRVRAGFDEFVSKPVPAGTSDIPKIFTEATSWLSARTDTQTPFFLFIHPLEVFIPYGSRESGTYVSSSEIGAINSQARGPTREEAARSLAGYKEDVRSVDTALKEFFGRLAASGLRSNTVVIITSGAGAEFGEHGSVGLHAFSLYNESIHVPLMIILPQKTAKRIGGNVELRSLPATLLDILNLPEEPAFEGASLVEAMRTETAPQSISMAQTGETRSHFLSVYLQNSMATSVQSVLIPGGARFARTASAVSWPWHALRTPDGGVHLYRIDTDPSEQQDLGLHPVLSPKDKKLVDELVVKLLLIPSQ
ncbi:MAG: Choline-sulfatase [Parcubacteria bacterium C7867-001]|nr:MAG: Choline-sulfatase [Parcubacteria bacterium C7867-001]